MSTLPMLGNLAAHLPLRRASRTRQRDRWHWLRLRHFRQPGHSRTGNRLGKARHDGRRRAARQLAAMGTSLVGRSGRAMPRCDRPGRGA